MINANSVDPYQMLHFAASDVDLLCLIITLLGVSQLKFTSLWVNSADDIDTFHIFPRECNLTFYAKYLLNVTKSCFLGKIRKIVQNFIC